LQSPTDRTKRSISSILFSCLLHGSLCACIVLLGTRARIRFVQPVQPRVVAQLAMSGGSHRIKIVLPPSNVSAHTHEPDANADPAKKTDIPMQVPALKKSGGGSPRSPHHGDGSSQALSGNGSDAVDIHPAFPIFSPHPPVRDRSLLPATEQKIVVDVDVDIQGVVVSEKLVKGMGTKLDQIVMETVKTWRFQPATVNGKPVPTEAELIFPFNQDYPIARS
jgi:protein TonB